MIESLKSCVRNQIINYLNRKFEKESLKLLLINAHMRSGSSLLVHILNTNPKIIGYGETHCTYQNESDFGATAYNIYRSFNKYYVSEDYILDKSVHPQDVKKIDLLNKAKTIFLIRPPEEAMPSIYKLDPVKYTPEVTYKYYTDRIKNLKQTALELSPEKWTLVTYNQLLKNQSATFKQIENLLNLKTNLSSEYKTIWSTGKGGIGDRSKDIYQGKILNNKKADKIIPEPLKPFVHKAGKDYTQCLKRMEKMKYVK